MKKIILSLLLLLPLSMVAQEVKIGVVRWNDITAVMPEVAAMENEMMVLQQTYQSELQSLENEYNRKYADFMAQGDSLTDNIKALRMQEINDLGSRHENLSQMAQQDVQKKYEELFTPIQDKALKAIEQVGEENGFTCVFHSQQLLYTGKNCEDITDKVKAKLGIR